MKQDIFSKKGRDLKNTVPAGDFEANKKVKDFLNLMVCYNIIPLTNKLT